MSSPFLQLPSSSWIASNSLAFAISDRYPVSPGHTLVIPRRLMATWFEATPEEQTAIFQLVEEIKRKLDAELKPDGYNIGINAGEAAGQTVMHLHVHVIPRYRGDVDDPRGGVRHVIPGKGNYLENRPPPLTQGGKVDPFLRHLDPLFRKATDIAILAAFVQQSGVSLLQAHVAGALSRGARVRLITGDYLHITQGEALAKLRDWMDGPGGFEERTVSVNDVGWVLAALSKVNEDPRLLQEELVHRLRYLEGTPRGSTRWIDTGWAVLLVKEAIGVEG